MNTAAPSGPPERGGRSRRPWARLLLLALPTLPVLAAEPLYLMINAVVVGRLGERELAALGAGSLVVLLLGTQMNFLSYGTTARASRWFGAGRPERSVAEGVQATWIALGVGVALVGCVAAVTGPAMRWLAPDPGIADAAGRWLHIAMWGIPLILVAAAGNGWLRGMQRTRPPLLYVVAGVGTSAIACPLLVHGAGVVPALGLRGAAIADVLGQSVTAAGFLVALAGASAGRLRPLPRVMAAQVVLGRDLVIRTAAFQVTLAVATSTAAVSGAATLAAHHVASQVWSLEVLVLDSVAVAAQTVVGSALGAGDTVAARAAARMTVLLSLAAGAVLAAVTAAARTPLAGSLTGDAAVAGSLGSALVGVAVVVVPAAVVFGLDGVLLGAADAAYLRTSTVLAALLGYLPVLLIAHHLRWGIAGIWFGMGVFVTARLVAVTWRVRGSAWSVTGAPARRGEVRR